MKSGAWDVNDRIFVYSTLNHIKVQCLPFLMMQYGMCCVLYEIETWLLFTVKEAMRLLSGSRCSPIETF